MAQDSDKTELIAELALARARLSDNVSALRRDLDFPTRARQAFKRGPVPWLAGAAALGLLVTQLPARRKPVVITKTKNKTAAAEAGKAGLVLGAMKFAFDFARPMLFKWATQRFNDYVAHSSGRPPRV